MLAAVEAVKTFMLAEIIIINAETWANSMIESSTNLIPWLKTLDIRDNHSIHVPIPSICAPVTYQWRSGDFSCDCYCICSRCQQHINSASFCFQRIYNYANKRNKQDDLLYTTHRRALGSTRGWISCSIPLVNCIETTTKFRLHTWRFFKAIFITGMEKVFLF